MITVRILSANCKPVLCRKIFTTLAMMRPNRPIIMNEPIAESERGVV